MSMKALAKIDENNVTIKTHRDAICVCEITYTQHLVYRTQPKSIFPIDRHRPSMAQWDLAGPILWDARHHYLGYDLYTRCCGVP
jgi:hypothetical protein